MSFGAGALIFQHGCVLTCLRGRGEHEPLTWGTFGGMAEEGEDPLTCMLREVKEESSIDLSDFDAHLIDSFEEGNGFKFYTYAVFLPDTDVIVGANDILTSSEVENWRWSKVIGNSDDPDEFWKHVRESAIQQYPLHSGLMLLTQKPEVIQALKAIRLITTGGGI
jgi:8-oxo-dGTP pyrophosphatase MutT (NUDIX family)